MVYGEGVYATTINFTPANTVDAFLKIYKPTSGAGVYGTAVKDFTALGVSGQYKGIGLDFRRVIYSAVQNLTLKYLDIGLNLDECFGNKYSDIQVWGCRINLNLTTSQNNANTFANLQLYNAAEVGAYIKGCVGIGFDGLVCEGNPIGIQLRGSNDGINIYGSYFESNAVHIDVGGGCTGLTSYSSAFRMNNGNIAYKFSNTNTQSVIELSSESDTFRANADNATINLFDFTNAAGSDDMRVSIRNPRIVKRTGTVVNHWVANGTPYSPPAHYFIHSDIPIRDLAALNVTIGSISQKENTLIYALDNDILRLKLNMTLVSTVQDGSQTPNRWNARFIFDAAAAPRVRTVVPISVYSGSVFSVKQGVMVIDTAGNVTLSFMESVAGLDLCAVIDIPR